MFNDFPAVSNYGKVFFCKIPDWQIKGPFTRSDLRIRFLVPKIGGRRSDGPISRFRFCGENVGRPFVVCSRGPISRTNKESSIWRQNDHRDMQNLSAPFIFQEECRMKIEHVLFPSVFFSKLRIRVSEGHVQCVHTIRFSEPTKIGSLKTGLETHWEDGNLYTGCPKKVSHV